MQAPRHWNVSLVLALAVVAGLSLGELGQRFPDLRRVATMLPVAILSGSLVAIVLLEARKRKLVRDAAVHERRYREHLEAARRGQSG